MTVPFRSIQDFFDDRKEDEGDEGDADKNAEKEDAKELEAAPADVVAYAAEVASLDGNHATQVPEVKEQIEGEPATVVVVSLPASDRHVSVEKDDVKEPEATPTDVVVYAAEAAPDENRVTEVPEVKE